jgi:hypothetical protein
MRKLKLDLDTLDVESFSTVRQQDHPGTIQGHDSGQQTCADSCDGVCSSYFCPSGTEPDSCEFSCIWTCDTCNEFNCM